MLNNLSDLAIIVPVHPNEIAWEGLVKDLRFLPNGSEIVFSGPKEPVGLLDAVVASYGDCFTIKMVGCELGRAKQMNAGASASARHLLWFVHADSRISPKTLSFLNASLAEKPDALHYFDLKFRITGSQRMAALLQLNQLGSYFRSHILNIPFGDQGFAMSRRVFDSVGGFQEDEIWAEDHGFVLSASNMGIEIKATGGVIETSDRKYVDNGWMRITSRHLYDTSRHTLRDLVGRAKNNHLASKITARGADR